MSDTKKLFIKILEAELDDLTEDFLLVEKKYKEKFERQDIGSFVYQENEAFLEHESECVSRLIEYLDTLDLSAFSTLDTLVEGIRAAVASLVTEYQYPKAIPLFINRKIDKVKIYATSGSLL